MDEKLQKEAEDFLSEPFETNFGFARACVDRLLKLNPSEKELFLCFVLENFGFIPNKKFLSVTEHLLQKELFDSLVEEQKKDLEILAKATAAIFPPTEEFAKYILGVMELQKDADRKAIVLWYMMVKNFLPYAPDLPSAEAVLPKTGDLEYRKFGKNMAMLLRLVNFGSDLTFLQKADILLKILPPDEPARAFFLATFIARHAKVVAGAAREAVFEELKLDGKTRLANFVADSDNEGKDEDEDEDDDPPSKPPKNGKGEN